MVDVEVVVVEVVDVVDVVDVVVVGLTTCLHDFSGISVGIFLIDYCHHYYR